MKQHSRAGLPARKQPDHPRYKAIFSPPSPPPLPPPPPPPPTPDDPEVKKRSEEIRLSGLRRRGRASTILTSGLGDTTQANVRRNTLGG
jgi:hypothetical protein